MHPSGGDASLRGMSILGAVFNLNHPAHYVHWHAIQLSVPNLIVIVLMLIVFALAIVLPFPVHRAATDKEAGS